jgi:hypothetical protein
MTVLTLGGCGVFDGRLVELFAGTPTLEILVAGRLRAASVAF